MTKQTAAFAEDLIELQDEVDYLSRRIDDVVTCSVTNVSTNVRALEIAHAEFRAYVQKFARQWTPLS